MVGGVGHDVFLVVEVDCGGESFVGGSTGDPEHVADVFPVHAVMSKVECDLLLCLGEPNVECADGVDSGLGVAGREGGVELSGGAVCWWGAHVSSSDEVFDDFECDEGDGDEEVAAECVEADHS